MQVRRVLSTPEVQAKNGTLVQLLSAATTWPGRPLTLAAEPTRAYLVLATNSGWIMKDPDNVVAATVILDRISVVDLEATGGTM